MSPMDLMADQQVTLSLGFTDEAGNPVPTPTTGYSTVYTVDNPALITLTDNHDGTALAVAVGPLGTTTVRVSVTWQGHNFVGELVINVVAGHAERITIVPGTPTEATPDA